MGIPGLTSFINRNSTKYLENLDLKDTLVIIDSSALTRFLYKKYDGQTGAFGGDYDVLAKIYTDFINLLTRCNVTPIFVFGGAYEQRKMGTIMSRISLRIKTYSQPMKSEECMPMFGGNVIIDILNDMDIPHINCDFEADSEIVVLAKLLNCPVISRDSDFYINTVPYIPLDKIILDLDSNIKVMNCQVYKVEKLLSEFGGLNLDYLPLVAALLGNDYIRQNTFSSLLQINSGGFNFGLKLERSIEWLRKQHDIKSAISNMTYKLSRNRNYIENQINNIINDYKNMNSKYLSFILQYKKMSAYTDRLRHLKPNGKSILPPWLEYNYRRGTVNTEVMNIVTLKKIFFKAQIEDYKKVPHYKISFKIMRSIIGLLFGKGESIPTVGRKDGLNIGEYKIKPYITNPYVPLNDLNKTELVYRKNIILNLVGIKKLEGVPKDMELFVLILIYWAVYTNNNIKSKHMHALIVCAIIFNVIKKIEIDPKNRKTEDNNGKSVIEENITKVNKEDCLEAMSVLSNYFQVSQYYNDKHLYYKIMHSFAQFQSCVYFFMILNSLLDFPFDQCRIEHFYKGTFLYNLCVQMENCDPEVFVSSKLFEKLDSINNVYKSIIEHINVLLPVPKKRATVSCNTGHQ
ncbi:unnamed protein product [Macrosiphum euphorbiae]|uniref:XPG N-terminal domain-containing protein n=1 Tax=Macrosiphum euphorbiae TaxID=13131 RepID=A0AAV0VR67_9HEMI|nr:unnamed protein product [Macrosiphum euphorbiae]